MMDPLSPCLFRHGERARVTGGDKRRRNKRLPLTPTLSPRKSEERENETVDGRLMEVAWRR
jgi:hypothetical protein